MDRELALSTAVLLPRDSFDFKAGLLQPSPTLAERVQLCPGERFASESSLAFCSGVLVDYDLVLTAAHCVHQVELSQMLVAFGYFYVQEGVLRLVADDVYRAEAVIAERADPLTAEPRVDYAWLRLNRSVRAPWHPVRGFRTEGVEPGGALTVLSAASGTPLKVDHGAAVADARVAQHDYFVADTDTFAGSSGGGAFDNEGVLLGTLSRGELDYTWTADQCSAPVQKADADASEQFSYASRAVEGLCASAPDLSSLCRADCGQPCMAIPPAPVEPSGGCQFAPPPARPWGPALLGFASTLLMRRRVRLSRRTGRLWMTQLGGSVMIPDLPAQVAMVAEISNPRARSYLPRRASARALSSAPRLGSTMKT